MGTNGNVNLPEKKFRAGEIVASVWKNTRSFNGSERVVRSVQLERRYKDKESGEWKSTGSIRDNQVGLAIFVLQEAQRHIFEAKQNKDGGLDVEEEDMTGTSQR